MDYRAISSNSTTVMLPVETLGVTRATDQRAQQLDSLLDHMTDHIIIHLMDSLISCTIHRFHCSSSI
jgi:hypothetical protein